MPSKPMGLTARSAGHRIHVSEDVHETRSGSHSGRKIAGQSVIPTRVVEDPLGRPLMAEGVAIYSDVRRFNVTTEERFK